MPDIWQYALCVINYPPWDDTCLRERDAEGWEYIGMGVTHDDVNHCRVVVLYRKKL